MSPTTTLRPGIALAALLLAGPSLAQNPPPPRPQPAPPSAPQAQPAPPPAAAQPQATTRRPDVNQRIDTARQLNQQGKLLQAADELQAAVDQIYSQLGRTYGATLPPAPQGWTVDQPDPQRLALMGAGMAAIREYRPVSAPPQQPNQPPTRMNARIVLDGDAVRAMAPLMGPGPLPQGTPQTVRKARLGNGDALVAYDPQLRAGEVSMLVGNRILLQVEGTGVPDANPMIAAMQSWNIAELKRLAGVP